MSVIRVEKSKNYTIMSNAHLRDKELSLKAKGLLSVVLSLPDNWEYSLSGLASICKESVTAIRSAINELQDMGYAKVEKLYPEKEAGRSRIEYSYTFFENKQNKESQDIGSQGIENLHVESLHVENRMQINTNELNTDELNTDSNKDFPKGKAIDNNKVFSPEKTGRSPSPDISYEYTIEEFRQFIAQKVSYILDEVEPSEKSDSLEPIVAIITDFYEQYYEKFHKRHPILTDTVYTKIILKLLEPIDVIWNEGFYLYVDAYREMIKKFFNTEYGKNSGHKTDYRMPYFMQDTVLENLYYQSGLH